MTTLRFQSGAQYLQFTTGSSYPSSNSTKIFGVQDRTADGSFQFEKLGITSKSRNLVFNLLPKSDYEQLVYWFVDVAEGGRNSFILIDEYGYSAEVIITDQSINFTEVFLDHYNGSINVEYLTEPIK